MISHFMAECPSRPITNYGTKNNPGAVCIPYYDFNLYSTEPTVIKFLKTEGNWPEAFQCLNSNCQLTTKANCQSIGDICVCHDTCPKGKSSFNEDILVPCSGKGVCRSNGSCICMHGYLPPNCQTHCLDTSGGCCKSDDECEQGKHCSQQNIEGIGTCL